MAQYHLVQSPGISAQVTSPCRRFPQYSAFGNKRLLFPEASGIGLDESGIEGITVSEENIAHAGKASLTMPPLARMTASSRKRARKDIPYYPI